MAALTDDMGFDSINDFLAFINIDGAEMKAGRPVTDKLLRQKMYNQWINSSEISTDRRNACHMVKTKKLKIDIAIRDLDDENVEVIENQWGKKLKTQKYIYSQHIKLMYQNFLKENPDAKASPSLYYHCKPFYISPANIREMEGCSCAKCLNPHSFYDCLRKHINNFPLSLTQYLTEGFECTEQSDINYPKLKCIECRCENGCKITNESKTRYDWDKKLLYYVFEKKTETYYNRQGEKKEYK